MCVYDKCFRGAFFFFDVTFKNTENTYIAQTDIVPVCTDS